jgi:hypothetical protein
MQQMFGIRLPILRALKLSVVLGQVVRTVILATFENDIGNITVRVQVRQIVCETPSSK